MAQFPSPLLNLPRLRPLFLLGVGVSLLGIVPLTGCRYLPTPPGMARFPEGTPATQAKLAQVKPGMTVAQVVAIFGSTGHIPKGSTVSNPPFMSWTNHDLTAAIVMFENGKTVQVAKVGDLK